MPLRRVGHDERRSDQRRKALAAWRDELGLDRLRADLTKGNSYACWQHYSTGEFHPIHERIGDEKAVAPRRWRMGWPIGGGLFSSSEFPLVRKFMQRGPTIQGPRSGQGNNVQRRKKGCAGCTRHILTGGQYAQLRRAYKKISFARTTLVRLQSIARLDVSARNRPQISAFAESADNADRHPHFHALKRCCLFPRRGSMSDLP